jgi:hypothetical protein
MRLRRASILTVIVTITSVLAVPALGASPNNPFVGSWESVDPAPDNSHVRLRIGGNGNWNIRDEAGSVCLDNGLGFVPVTARGTGQFTSPDTYEADPGNIYCYPRDGQGRQFLFPNLSTGYAYWEIPDVLIDQFGVCWWRTGTGDPSNCPPD